MSGDFLYKGFFKMIVYGGFSSPGEKGPPIKVYHDGEKKSRLRHGCRKTVEPAQCFRTPGSRQRYFFIHQGRPGNDILLI